MNKLEKLMKAIKEQGIIYCYTNIVNDLFGTNNIPFTLKWKKYLIEGTFHTDLKGTFYDVLSGKTYDFPIKTKEKTIYDVGANIGCTSIFFRDKYPEAQIIAVEPVEENAYFLEKNIADLNIQFIQAPVWYKRTRLDLVTAHVTSCGSFKQTGKGEYLAITIPEILWQTETKRISILKMDIEGAEEFILTKNNSWLNKVDNIIVELHSSFRGVQGTVVCVPKVLREMERKGFVLKQVKQNNFWFERKQ